MRSWLRNLVTYGAFLIPLVFAGKAVEDGGALDPQHSTR